MSEELFPGMSIVLLTRGRVDNQHFLDNFHEDLRGLLTIVCHPGEGQDHLANWGGQVKDVVEYSGNNVGEARQWIMDNIEGDYILFCEDNVHLGKRMKDRGDDFGNVRQYGLYELKEEFFKPETILEFQYEILADMYDVIRAGKYGMVGLSERQGNFRMEEDFKECGRLYGVWAINKQLYNKIGAKFSDVIYREDFYIILSFLANSIPNLIFYKYAFNKVGGVNTKGGCSTYRNKKGTNENALMLAEMFDPYVKAEVKEKKSWKGYNDDGEDILDLRVQWKKLYTDSLKYKTDE